MDICRCSCCAYRCDPLNGFETAADVAERVAVVQSLQWINSKISEFGEHRVPDVVVLLWSGNFPVVNGIRVQGKWSACDMHTRLIAQGLYRCLAVRAPVSIAHAHAHSLMPLSIYWPPFFPTKDLRLAPMPTRSCMVICFPIRHSKSGLGQ